MREAAPIFVAGLDHSGKTTLRVALGKHPAICMVRHLELWTRLHGWYGAGPASRQRVLDALTSGRAAQLGLDREELNRSSAGDDFASLVRAVGRQLGEVAGTRRWGLQEALLEFQAAAILKEMPLSRIIYVVRDPRDRYREMQRARAVGRGGLAAEVAAWVASVRAARDAAVAWPDAVLVVRYETLLDDPDASLQRICEFVGEPYVASMISERPPPEAHEPLPDRDIAFIQERAASEMRALGYALVPTADRTGMLRRRLADASRWQLGRLAWRMRSRHLGHG